MVDNLTKEKVQKILVEKRKEFKNNVGFNQKALSYKCGVTQTTLSYYFSKTPQRIVTVIKLLHFLDLEIKDFEVIEHEKIRESLKIALKNKCISKNFLADSMGYSDTLIRNYFDKDSKNLITVIKLLKYLELEIKDFYN